MVKAPEKEMPIPFRPEMVRAILDGRKTVTRRVVKFQKPFANHSAWKNFYPHPGGGYIFTDGPLNNPERDIPVMAAGRTGKTCPYGQPGDRLWVREAWFCAGANESDGYPVRYRATADILQDVSISWRPSIFMPRWASRITLEVTGVRVERVQEITKQQVMAEGLSSGMANLEPPYSWDWRGHFKALWDGLNASRGFGWDKNPWVWVIEFRRVKDA